MSIAIRVFGAATLIAWSAVSIVGQNLPQEPDPDPTIVKPNTQKGGARAAGSANVVAHCGEQCAFVASTGNLYITSSAINEAGPDSASFLRTSKSGVPGSEGVLYQETGDTPSPVFGKPVWAYTSGRYYGYFVANYNQLGTNISQIKRVPLEGGPAVVLALAPDYIGGLDLVTDGIGLYWADSSGIRRMSINGGPVGTLVPASSFPGGAFRIGGVDANYLYFAKGRTIGRVLKTGGVLTILANTEHTVTTMYAHLSPTNWGLYWGEIGGAVRGMNSYGSTFSVYSPSPGSDVTSVGFDGTRVLWIECQQPSNNVCPVYVKDSGGIHVAAGGGYSARNLQWDANSMYWVGGTPNGPAVLRFVH